MCLTVGEQARSHIGAKTCGHRSASKPWAQKLQTRRPRGKVPAGLECKGIEPRPLGTEQEEVARRRNLMYSVSRRKPQFRAGQSAEHVDNVAVMAPGSPRCGRLGHVRTGG